MSLTTTIVTLITTSPSGGRRLFEDPVCARAAVESLYAIRDQYLFTLYDFVVLPSECRLLLSLPPTENISFVMRAYKEAVTKRLGQGKVWEPHFRLRVIDEAGDVLRSIHRAPVDAGIVGIPAAYPWSSASEEWEVASLDEI